MIHHLHRRSLRGLTGLCLVPGAALLALSLGLPPVVGVPQDGGDEAKQDEHEGHDHGQDEKSLQGRYGGQVDPDAKLLIDYETDQHQFGTVRQGMKMEHAFRMSSGGTAPLIIRQVKPTCGCTVGKVSTREAEDGEWKLYTMGEPIAPGTAIQVEAALDTSNKRNNTQVRINVYANDPVGLHTLTLGATVEPFMTATPTALMFGELSEDSVKEGTVNVRTANEPVMLRIDESRPVPKPEGLVVELTPVNPGEDGRSSHWQVKASVGPKLQEGPFGYQVHLVSDKEMENGKAEPDGSKEPYSIFVNVNARVLGVLSCSPQYLSMGLVRPGQVVGRSVRIQNHDETFELSNVQASVVGYKGEEFPWAESFTTNLRPVPGQDAVDVELRLEGLPEGSDGSFKGQVLIQTGHPKKPEVEVTFSGVCRAGIVRGNVPVGTRQVPVRETPVPQPKESGEEAGNAVGKKDNGVEKKDQAVEKKDGSTEKKGDAADKKKDDGSGGR